MKKLILVLLMVCLVPGLVYSQTSPWPPEGYEVEAFQLMRDSTWQTMGVGDVSANARCFGSFPLDSSCNKDWKIPVKMHASVAQWILWSMTATRWDWFVRKPGHYAADCVSVTICSNQNVLLNFEDFGDLVAVDPDKAIDDTIEVWYAFWGLGTPPTWDDDVWRRSYMLNDPAEWDTIFDSMALHHGRTWKLWARISVSNCNSACEYQDDAFISLYLCCQKSWIDRETGLFIATGGS